MSIGWCPMPPHHAATATNRFDSKVIVDQETVILPADCNQVQELAKFAYHFIYRPEQIILGVSFAAVDPLVLDRLTLFHTDSVACAVSAVALHTNAPSILRQEALEEYRRADDRPGSLLFGCMDKVAPEKAIVANCAAVREWDSNGTSFGWRAAGSDSAAFQAGEFGHNDFYPVVIAAAHLLYETERTMDGRTCLRAMLCLDEIRGRFAEVFSLKTYKIDHVLFGSIASAIVYGTLLGASIKEIESAVGMTVSHYSPWRAIRAGHQLSDSKGASAALSTEAAILSVHRSMKGFAGPSDIFRNPDAPFRLFKPTIFDESPFDLILTHSGSNFSVTGMHFKLGIYEHQAASGIHGLITLISQTPLIYQDLKRINSIRIICYKPAVDIIGDAAKWNPETRQSADHSMVYILSTILRKASEQSEYLKHVFHNTPLEVEKLWLEFMLSPRDFSESAIYNETTRSLMTKMTVEHGGEEFDRLYPEGIPTRIQVQYTTEPDSEQLHLVDSGMVLFPLGHARCTSVDIEKMLMHKIIKMTELGLDSSVNEFVKKLQSIGRATPDDIYYLYDVEISSRRMDQI